MVAKETGYNLIRVNHECRLNLSLLSTEFMLHPGARVLNQWNRRHASLQEGFLVGEARRLLDPVVASQVEDRLAAMHGAFEKLSSIRSSLPPRDRARAQRILAGRLLSDAEYVVTLVVRYANGGEARALALEQALRLYLFATVALFLGAYVITSIMMRRT